MGVGDEQVGSDREERETGGEVERGRVRLEAERSTGHEWKANVSMIS